MEPTAKPAILIVEDDVLLSAMLRLGLEHAGYKVVAEAGDGQQALQLALELRPDLILMDIAMPSLDGLQAAEAIQAACPTPIVIVTSFDTPEMVDRARAAGVYFYLVKPLRFQDLDRIIGEVFRHRRGG